MGKIKLTKKQSLILDVLKNEFAGEAFGTEMLEKTENADVKLLTAASITSTLSSLSLKGIVAKAKSQYGEKMLTKFTITPEFAGCDAEVELID